MKRVLVTGATGFIGRHSLPGLIARGYEVHAAGRTQPTELPPDVHWRQTDLMDWASLGETLRAVRPTHLLHFAWYAVPGKYWTSPENLRWIQASLALACAFVEQGGRRLTVAGTCAEYDWSRGHCSEFTTALAPATLYGASKHALRVALEAYCREVGVSLSWGRIFHTYGPHEQPVRLVASVIGSLLRGEIARCSHGEQVRDFLYVEDLGDAFAALLDSGVEGAVNVASGSPVTVKEVVRQIADKLHCADRLQLGALPAAPNDPPVLTADVTRLTSEVGWRPTYGLSEGLDRTIQWFKRQKRDPS